MSLLFEESQEPAKHSPYLGALTRRRFFAQASAIAGGLAGGLIWPALSFAATSEIHELKGSVRINGVQATLASRIQPGDRIICGSEGQIVFVVDGDAFMLRSRSELLIEKPAVEGSLVSALRLVTGALAATFGKGRPRTIRTNNATAGIRGTGVYLETRSEGLYFCTCWGSVELTSVESPKDREWIDSTYHTPRLISDKPMDGSRFKSAAWETHTDAEMELLEKCAGRGSPFKKTP